MNLGELLLRRTAVVTSEVQNGVVGEPAIFPALARQVQSEQLVPRLAGLLDAARRIGVPVVHGVAHRRPDDLGASTNARLFAAAAKAEVRLTVGSEAARVVPSLWDNADLVSSRLHGVGPYAGTDLGPLLVNLGVETVVVVGVSVNVAITNLVMDLVNAGHQVVLPRDGVTGIPRDHADAVIDHTLGLLATVCTCDDLIQAWLR